MTMVDTPGALDPGAWRFGFDDLEAAGIVFADQQLEMYERASHEPIEAMLVDFPLDPEPMSPGRRKNLQMPLFTVDELGGSNILAVPGVVSLASIWDDRVSMHHSALRYPSLVGRQLIPTNSEVWGPDVSLEEPLHIRLWNLWPINDMQVEDVLDGTRLWRSNNYNLLAAWWACEQGKMDPCDIVTEHEGFPYDSHSHTEHIDLDGDATLLECHDGEYWLEQFAKTHFTLDDDGLTVPKPMPEIRLCDPELQQLWEYLRDSSAINAFKAIEMLPERHREAVLRTERHYSPWLWSS
jgi:hypothetical protein